MVHVPLSFLLIFPSLSCAYLLVAPLCLQPSQTHGSTLIYHNDTFPERCTRVGRNSKSVCCNCVVASVAEPCNVATPIQWPVPSVRLMNLDGYVDASLQKSPNGTKIYNFCCHQSWFLTTVPHDLQTTWTEDMGKALVRKALIRESPDEIEPLLEPVHAFTDADSIANTATFATILDSSQSTAQASVSNRIRQTPSTTTSDTTETTRRSTTNNDATETTRRSTTNNDTTETTRRNTTETTRTRTTTSRPAFVRRITTTTTARPPPFSAVNRISVTNAQFDSTTVCVDRYAPSTCKLYVNFYTCTNRVVKRVCPQTCNLCRLPPASREVDNGELLTSFSIDQDRACVDNWNHCSAYVKLCETDSRVQILCPRTCETCHNNIQCADDHGCAQYGHLSRAQCGVWLTLRCPLACKHPACGGDDVESANQPFGRSIGHPSPSPPIEERSRTTEGRRSPSTSTGRFTSRTTASARTTERQRPSTTTTNRFGSTEVNKLQSLNTDGRSITGGTETPSLTTATPRFAFPESSAQANSHITHGSIAPPVRPFVGTLGPPLDFSDQAAESIDQKPTTVDRAIDESVNDDFNTPSFTSDKCLLRAKPRNSCRPSSDLPKAQLRYYFDERHYACLLFEHRHCREDEHSVNVFDSYAECTQACIPADGPVCAANITPYVDLFTGETRLCGRSDGLHEGVRDCPRSHECTHTAFNAYCCPSQNEEAYRRAFRPSCSSAGALITIDIGGIEIARLGDTCNDRFCPNNSLCVQGPLLSFCCQN